MQRSLQKLQALSGSMPLHPQRGPILVGSAVWLANNREDDEWSIIDTMRPSADPRKVSFQYMLPDGSLMTAPENSHLYRTVKQFGVMVREGPYAISDDLEPSVHATCLTSLMHILGWMRLNDIRALTALTRAHIDRLCEEASLGGCAMLQAPERLKVAMCRLLDEEGLDAILTKRSRYEIRRSAALTYAAIPLTMSREPSLAALLRTVENYLRTKAPLPEIAQALAKQTVPVGTELTYEAIRRNLRPLEDLWRFRHHIEGDNIRFDPYPDGLANLARDLGTEIQRTPTIPQRQAMELLDRSIRWVVDYADPILTAYERATWLKKNLGQDPADAVATAVGEVTNCVEGPGAPWPLLPDLRRTRKDLPGLTLPEAVRFLVLACFIVIASFTGRRLNEILDIVAKCTRGDARYGYWIRTYIEKTLRDVDETPCPRVVVLAVEGVLERLNRDAIAMDPSHRLCEWIAVETKGAILLRRLNPGEHLDQYAEFVGVTALANGKFWHFTPHQFRRFFAIAYIWRYQFGDLGALAHHLRHFSLRMTLRYVTEAIAGMVIEEERAMTTTVFVEAAQGNRQLGGSAGSRFMQLLTKAKNEISVKVRIILPARLKAYVERFVGRSGVLLKCNPWSYCTCPLTVEGAARANCRSGSADPQPDARGPDLAEAKPETCAKCIFNLTDACFRPFLEREIADTRARLSSGYLPPPAREADERRLLALEGYISDFPTARGGV